MGSPFSRRRFLHTGMAGGAVLLGGGATLLSACGGDDDDDTSSSGSGEGFGDLAVQLSWIKNIEFAGAYVADSEGYFAAFSGTVADVVATLRKGWYYEGQNRPDSTHPRGTPADGIDPQRFVRVHRGHIVNLDHVRAFERDLRGNVEAELPDGRRVPVSRTRAQELRRLGL